MTKDVGSKLFSLCTHFPELLNAKVLCIYGQSDA